MQDRQVCVLGFFKISISPIFLNLVLFTAVLSLSPSDGEGKQAPACTVKASIASPKPAGHRAMPGMYSFLSRDQMHQAVWGWSLPAQDPLPGFLQFCSCGIWLQNALSA